MNQEAGDAGVVTDGSGSGSDREPSRDGRETEIKFRTDAEGLKRAMACPVFGLGSALKPVLLRSIYFDTRDGDLRNSGSILRIRKDGRATPVLTFKLASGAAAGPFQRREIEVRCRSAAPDLTLFDDTVAAAISGLVGEKPLEPQFETQIKRSVANVRAGGSIVEVAFDEGTIVAGEKRLAIAEVELELKSGEEADLCDLAIDLVRELPLRLDFVSKAQKGFRMSAGIVPSPAQAAPVVFAADATLDDAVNIVVGSTLEQFVANWSALRETDQPETIHQMRVSLRRMRSALAMFGRALPCPQFEVFRSEAKRIASSLGPVREYDAFCQSARRGPLAYPQCPPAGNELIEAVERHRNAALAEARLSIDDAAATLFVLELHRFLSRRAWRDVLSRDERALLSMPAKSFARATLARLHRRALRLGKRLSKLNDAERHRLRIALKKLRYGADFFISLFPARRNRADVRAVSALQDILGAQNDSAVAMDVLAQISGSLGPQTERAAGFVLGWDAREASRADARLLRRWKKFKKAGVFWR